jgi:thiamine-phosphate pyrophosphorylase
VIRDANFIDDVADAIDGGAAVVQYRDKGGDPELRATQAAALAGLCAFQDTLFLINDDVELAQSCQADGVHLGRDDPPLLQARDLLGEDAVIGISCYNDLERACAAEQAGASYVAFGSFYPSDVKPDAVRTNIELLRQAKNLLRIPVVAIGGITPDNAPELVAAGADAIAVITGVFGQPDIQAAARSYAELFK